MFVKAQFASLVASVIDFLTTIFLASILNISFLPSSMTGMVVGGICHFTISRKWVFYATDKDSIFQIVKYVMVWVGNFALNAAGQYVLLHYSAVNYIITKALVAIVVGTFYNYALQKRFVFK